MSRPVLFSVFLCVLLLGGCGGNEKVLGNLCAQPGCEYDKLGCYFRSEPDPSYQVIYSWHQEQIAIIDISLRGIDDVSQFTLPIPDPEQRVQISSSVLIETLSEATALNLVIKAGGLETGKTLQGEIVGLTLDGYRVSIDFNCVLDRIVAD